METPGKGGRRRQYLSLEEERAFLAPFFGQAEQGEIATAGEIKRAFEDKVGHEVDESTIYRLLHRHGWRKLMPRPRHPKADLQTQEQFKKNFPTQVEAAVATREARNDRSVLIMAQDEGRFGCISRAKRCWAPLGICGLAHGFPLRLAAPGRRGFEWVKWITSIEVLSKPDSGQILSIFISRLTDAKRGG